MTYKVLINAPLNGASKVFTNSMAMEIAAYDLYENFKEHCSNRNWESWCEEFYDMLLQVQEEDEDDD